MKLKEQAEEKIKILLGVSSCSLTSILPNWHQLILLPAPTNTELPHYAKLLEAAGIKISYRLASDGIAPLPGYIDVRCTFENIVNSNVTEFTDIQQLRASFNNFVSPSFFPPFMNQSSRSNEVLDLTIHDAVKNNQLHEVKRLLQMNSKLRDEEEYYNSILGGVTPLELAAIHGHSAIVNHLLSLGAGINKKVITCGNLPNEVKEIVKEVPYRKVGLPPNHFRCGYAQRSTSVVEEIEQACISGSLKLITDWIEHDPNCITTNPEAYESPLKTAISCGKSEILRLLLDNDVVPHKESLYWAAFDASKTSCAQQMQVLIEYGAGKDPQMNSRTFFRALSMENCQPEVIKILLTLPIDWHLQDINRGLLLLHYALEQMPDVIPLMVSAGADINQVDDKGFTLLHTIASGQLNPNQELKILHAILKLKPDPSIRLPLNNGDWRNVTAYQYAYFINKHIIAQVLAEYTIHYPGNIEPHNTLLAQQQQIAACLQELQSQRSKSGATQTSDDLDQLDDLAIGLQYRIPAKEITTLKTLGEGNFGVVTLSKWHNTLVAIKTIKANYSNEALTIFEKEADILFKLRHPNIISMFGISVDADANKYSIIMEYMPTGSLNSVLLADQPLDWNFRVKIINDIANGLHYLHQKQITHGDLRSDNVLLNGEIAKIGDFGLAKTQNNQKSAPDTIGVIPWMAPELFLRRPYTTESDIYSLGMVIWEIVTRQEPWQEENVTTVIGLVVSGEREKIPDDAPVSLAKLIRFCWEHKVSDRYTANDVVEYLAKACIG